MKLGGNRPPGDNSPSLFDKWHGIFYMPSRIDEAGHTKTFDYPVVEHWGKAEMFSSAGGTRTDNTSVRSRARYQLSHPGSPRGSHNPGSSTGGIFSQTGGIVCKEQPRHEKAIPMGPREGGTDGRTEGRRERGTEGRMEGGT